MASDNGNEAKPTKPPSARRSVGFQASHARKFGLMVTQRDPESGAVLAAACLFCRHEGREAKEGRKRKVTANCKVFRLSFRTDQYTQHLLSQHPRAWARYCAATEFERRTFFPVVSPDDDLGDVKEYNDDLPPKAAKTPLRRIISKKPRVSVSLATPTSSGTAVAAAATATVPAPMESSTVAAVQREVLAVAVKRGSQAPAVEREALAASVESIEAEAAQSTRAADNATAAVAATGVVATPASFNVRKQLVDLVLGAEQIWRPVGCLTCTLLNNDNPDARAVYSVTARQRMQLEVVVDLAALGLVPRQIAKTLTATVTRTGLDPALVVTEEEVVELVRLSTAVCLDAISKLLERCWGFSIGVRTAEGSADLEVRLRVHSGKKVHNVHLVAIPVSDHPNADVSAMFQEFERVMSGVFPAWRSYLVGLGSDGDATMSNHVARFISRIRQEVPRMVYSTWCGSAQLNIVMQQFYRSLLSGVFVTSFKALKAYIRSQESLAREMSYPSSITSTNPWFEMGIDAKWVTDKRVRIHKHLDDEKPLVAPSDSWWVTFFIVHWISGRSNETLRKLQNKNLIVTQQTALLSGFVKEIVREFNIQGPLKASDDPDTAATDAQVEAAPENLVFSTQRQYAIAKANILEFIGDLGIFVRNIVARTNSAELDAAVESLAVCLVNLVESLTSMMSELQKRSTDAAEVLPPAFPQELAELSGREFASLLERHSDQLRVLFNEEELDMIDQAHQALRRAGAKEKMLKDASIDRSDDPSSFEHAWSVCGGRFPALQNFAGGLATVFSAAVSDDFTSNDFADLPRASSNAAPHAADFALEGALHAQQFHKLQGLL